MTQGSSGNLPFFKQIETGPNLPLCSFPTACRLNSFYHSSSYLLALRSTLGFCFVTLVYRYSSCISCISSDSQTNRFLDRDCVPGALDPGRCGGLKKVLIAVEIKSTFLHKRQLLGIGAWGFVRNICQDWTWAVYGIYCRVWSCRWKPSNARLMQGIGVPMKIGPGFYMLNKGRFPDECWVICFACRWICLVVLF